MPRLDVGSFRGWRDATPLRPKPHLPPNVTYMGSPVCECLQYRDRYFFRDRHCVGVAFATFVLMDHREVGVVWTTTRRAYIFEYVYLTGWVLFKVLNRQHDPYRTWLRHLGGDALLVAPCTVCGCCAVECTERPMSATTQFVPS